MNVMPDLYRIHLDRMPETSVIMAVGLNELPKLLRVHLSFTRPDLFQAPLTHPIIAYPEECQPLLDGLVQKILNCYVPNMENSSRICLSGDWFPPYEV